MPIYEYECEPCDREYVKILPMHMHDIPQMCTVCGKAMRKLISMFNTTKITWGKDQYDIGLGKVFTSPKQKEDYIKKKGLRKLGKNEHSNYYPPKPKEITIKELHGWAKDVGGTL